MTNRLQGKVQFDPELVQTIAQGDESVLASFDAVEQVGNQFYEKYYLPEYEIPGLKQIAAEGGNLVHMFRSELVLFHLLQGRRLAEHLADIVQSFIDRRLLATTLALRAVLEVTAAVVYYVSKMTETLPDGGLTDEDCQRFGDLLDKALGGGRFDWSRWASGAEDRQKLREAYGAWARRKADEPKPELQQTNVMTMVQHLAKHMGSREEQHRGLVETSYALLSDMCHPSVGATFLATLSEPEDDRSVVRPGASDLLINWYWWEVISPVLQPIMIAAKDSLEQIDKIAGGLTWQPSSDNTSDHSGDAG
ncbi:MAG: hypothetical protein ACYSWU_04975 [Planctomycetota bacterium]|jgi:hypothetical protein